MDEAGKEAETQESVDSAVDVRLTNGSGRILTVDGEVIVRELGRERYRIESPFAVREVRGYKLACVVAREMVEKLSKEDHGVSSP
jgi:hypothetical protein